SWCLDRARDGPVWPMAWGVHDRDGELRRPGQELPSAKHRPAVARKYVVVAGHDDPAAEVLVGGLVEDELDADPAVVPGQRHAATASRVRSVLNDRDPG